MKVNSATKRYWARTGPCPIFGFDWEARREMSNAEAEALWDSVWESKLKPAIQSASRVPADTALTMIPQDRRKDYFDPNQEHREFMLNGVKLLVQIDTANNEVSQMWHLLTQRGPISSKENPDTRAPESRSLSQLAERMGISHQELATALGHAFTEILLKS